MLIGACDLWQIPEDKILEFLFCSTTWRTIRELSVTYPSATSWTQYTEGTFSPRRRHIEGFFEWSDPSDNIVVLQAVFHKVIFAAQLLE